MIVRRWSCEIHGTIAYCLDNTVLTAPQFGDGNWRGGWWARYRRDDGQLQWKRFHRRGACFFDIVDDAIVATTHKWSGVYAFSLRNGHHLWSRLGDRFDFLLRLFEWLPCDNEGDPPECIYEGGILTRSGRLLDHATGRILRRCELHYRSVIHSKDNSTMHRSELDSIDGHPAQYSPPRARYCLPLDGDYVDELDRSLAAAGLERSGLGLCSIARNGNICVIACEPPVSCRAEYRSRFFVPAKPMDVPHHLLIVSQSSGRIVSRWELGSYYQGQIAWADARTLAITLQSRKQWNWSYRRNLLVFDWRRDEVA
jgi:hypothetical protein